VPQTKENPNWFRFLIIVLCIFLFCAGIVQLLTSLNPFPNDDAFVYYNYAQNITEGRPFAYDIRNIPSEGFTSLLYLLLLTPFEFFKFNMTFASLLINLIAIIGMIIVAGKLVRVSNLLTKESTLVLLAVFWVWLVNDVNVKVILESGLETMLGPLIVLLAVLALVYSGIPPYTHRGVNAFFILLFMAYITRPESMIFMALAGLPILLINKTSRKEILRKLIVFTIIFTAYHILKFFIFGDIMPTGFYRKVSSGSGFGYVGEWIHTYKTWIKLLAIEILVVFVYSARKGQLRLIFSHWLWFLMSVTTMTLLFFTQTRPLVGEGFRFLITPLCLVYFLVSLLTLWLLEHISISDGLKKTLYLGSLLLLVTLSGMNSIAKIKNISTWDELNIYSKVKRETERHLYLKLGYYLHDAIPQSDDVTLVFGDAGAIPYSFGGRFIDFNGLTEPAIAHLFQQPDGPEKTRTYIDYILSQQPDVIVLAWGDLESDGTWSTERVNHSPFRKDIPIEIYKAYQKYGIVYQCSIRLYYDLHIGLWDKSPYYKALQTAFSNYCIENGYVLPDGLIVSNGVEKVVFPSDYLLKE
jgi:hypothetical protein